jgi:hypothetical protein
VGADKFYVHSPEAISHGNYQPKVIALDVENDSAAFENAGGRKVKARASNSIQKAVFCG